MWGGMPPLTQKSQSEAERVLAAEQWLQPLIGQSILVGTARPAARKLQSDQQHQSLHCCGRSIRLPDRHQWRALALCSCCISWASLSQSRLTCSSIPKIPIEGNYRHQTGISGKLTYLHCSCYCCADCVHGLKLGAFKAGVPAELRCAIYEHQHQCLSYGQKRQSSWHTCAATDKS